MKKIFFLLGWISLFYSGYVASHDTETGTGNNPGIGTNQGTNNNPGIGVNPGTNIDPNAVDTPGKGTNQGTSNDEGLGNAGNTHGVGTDHGGGNGPAN